MKRVNIILTVMLVSMFSLSSCGDNFDEIEVKEPTSKSFNDDETEFDGSF